MIPLARPVIPLARPVVAEDDIAAVVDVLRSGALASGAKVTAFEEAFAAYCGVRHAVAVANGTVALQAALTAVGVGPGDRVLTTPFTFIASSNSIRHCGATPVFADIDPRTYNLDVDSARRALDRTPNVKAILLVHLYGLPCDLDAFAALARERELVLVEDCAQAHGSTLRGRTVGSVGKAGAFSFYATKNLMTGEGGMVVTDDADVAAYARKLINHGRTSQYGHDVVGYNFRLTNIAATLGLGQLARLPAMNERRRAIAARYDAAFADHPHVTTPFVPEGYGHTYHQYTLRTRARDGLKAHLEQRGVASAIVYPTPNCQQACYRGVCGCAAGAEVCREATRASAEVLSIPVHPALTDAEVDAVIDAVRSFTPAV